MRTKLSFSQRCRYRQHGAALMVALLILMMVSMIGVSAAHIAIQEEKASRSERDWQIAMQAAEAALADAERDIENSSRSDLFAQDKSEGFAENCGGGQPDQYAGLCRSAEAGQVPVWQTFNFSDAAVSNQSVTYGRFTGQVLQTGDGLLPVREPEYIIELMSHKAEGEDALKESTTYFYRITAVGFGLKETTQVALQTFYRKAGGNDKSAIPAGRFGWREISNWTELRNAQ